MPVETDPQISYRNGKIYIGKDFSDSAGYFGSANDTLIASGFGRQERLDLTIRKQIPRGSETAPDQETNRKEIVLSWECRSNEPSLGSNQWPNANDQSPS